MPPLNNGRMDLSACVVGERVYVCGGESGEGERLSTCEYYDSKKNEWSMMPEMHNTREGAAIAVIDDDIYGELID